MKALVEAAKCEPTRLDEGDLAFKLAPRINAAGRLYRADAGVELFLTDDEARAAEIAVLGYCPGCSSLPRSSTQTSRPARAMRAAAIAPPYPEPITTAE